MTSKERMLVAMRNGRPDCVPVAPDTSNMIPCRLTGKPFWDIYLYQDPPLWMAYIGAVKHFGFDGWLPGVPIQLDYERPEVTGAPQWQEAIVRRTPDRIYTRFHAVVKGTVQWADHCTVYYIDNPPTRNLPPAKVGLPEGPPTEWEDVHPRTRFPGTTALAKAQELMGDAGVVGVGVGLPGLSLQPESVYEFYDHRDKVIARCENQRRAIVRRTRELVKLRPDFILIGISGHMINNPEPIFRVLSLPTLKDVTAVCKEAGVPSQIHCCGPEYSLVKMSAEESDLSNINPLEIPPMGDCDLARVKKEFGKKLSLMGNLHTTNVMLKGSAKDVELASKKAMDDAAEGGGFILSTGDQCGRDTPDANIFAMIETARTYGRY
jgi:uroporphyrinogen decarboxylase